MQAIAPVTFAQLLAAGQQPLLNFEVWVVDEWIPLTALDTKNYVESISISLGGAGMSPNPIGGTWNASLSNEDSIFHPKHPTSGYVNYLKTGMKVRIKVGAHYGVTDYYWQRLIGYIDEPRFEGAGQKVNVSGADYMKLLEDTEFRIPDNYWGTFETFNSLSSEGLLGDEIYTEENDAMTYPAEGEADNVANWTHPDCDFDSYDAGGADPNQPSAYVGQMINQVSGARVINTDVGTAEAGKEYRVKFKHRAVDGYEGPVGIHAVIKQNGAYILPLMNYMPTDDWQEETFYFTATHNGAIEMQFWCASAITDLRLDQISIWEFIDYWDIHYQLTDTEAKGPYYVTLDDVPVWQGERDEGWYYAEEEDTGDEPHPARVLFFDANKEVANGTDNLVIHYFETTPLEDVVARILYKAKLYASEADAKTAMEYTDPEIDVDKVWFEPGTSLLDGLKKVCERCNYRFYFKWDGTPVFKPAPSYTDVLTDGGLNVWTSPTNLTNWTETVLGTSSINKEAAEKVEGDFSCRIDVDAGNSLSSFNQAFSMVSEKRYKVIIWYKNSAVGKTAQFQIRDSASNVYLKSDGTWQGGAVFITLPNSTTWTPFELEFDAHAAYTDYQIYLKVLSAASSSIYFDDVSIWREEFTFSEQKHIASFTNYQDRNEIKNRIAIEGMKQAEPVNKEETIPPELRGEKSDATSIDTYGERTLSIRNHLFQTQDSILNEAGDAGMCVTLLAVYKDPKLYADIEVPFNPVPLELGDMIGWKERLSPTLEVIRRGRIRDIKIDGFRTIYKCEDPT